MKFSLKITETNIYNLSRKIGYYFLAEDKEKGERSLIRPLSPAGYPRFHLYVETKEKGGVNFKLHLDQKKPVYKGAPAHSGEYEGKILGQEMERIKKVLNSES